MRVVYCGPFAAVEVPAAGIVAKRGEAVDVPKGVGRNLVAQKDWKRAPAPSGARTKAKEGDA